MPGADHSTERRRRAGADDGTGDDRGPIHRALLGAREVCRGVADRRQGARGSLDLGRVRRGRALGQFVLNAGVSATDCCSSRWFAAQADANRTILDM